MGSSCSRRHRHRHTHTGFRRHRPGRQRHRPLPGRPSGPPSSLRPGEMQRRPAVQRPSLFTVTLTPALIESCAGRRAVHEQTSPVTFPLEPLPWSSTVLSCCRGGGGLSGGHRGPWGCWPCWLSGAWERRAWLPHLSWTSCYPPAHHC